MQLTRPKVIAITFLAVLVALGSTSLFAQNGSSATTVPTLQLTPPSGCPGQQIELVAIFPLTEPLLTSGSAANTVPVTVTSVPDGLISQGKLGVTINNAIEVRGTFIVGDICGGPYVVTVKLMDMIGAVPSDSKTLESVSAHFTAGDSGCPNLPSCLRPVGGVVMPMNTLAITAPYLALAGLIVAVSAVVVVKKRRA